jgi:hypothetical protein
MAQPPTMMQPTPRNMAYIDTIQAYDQWANVSRTKSPTSDKGLDTDVSCRFTTQMETFSRLSTPLKCVLCFLISGLK